MADEQAKLSSMDLRYLDPADVRIWVGEDRRVYATIADDLTVITPVFVRSHPLTDPDRYISIRGSDPKENSPAKGTEFGLLRNWQRIDSTSRELIELELGRRYLHPRVTAILSTRDYSGLRVCVFQTDRGEREVTLRDIRDNVIYLGGNRVLITDAEGNRYDVDNIETLDPESQARLARIL